MHKGIANTKNVFDKHAFKLKTGLMVLYIIKLTNKKFVICQVFSSRKQTKIRCLKCYLERKKDNIGIQVMDITYSVIVPSKTNI